MSRNKGPLLAFGAALAMAVFFLLARNTSEQDFREVRPPTPVSDASTAPPASDLREEEAPSPDDAQAAAASDAADSDACENRFSDQKRPSREEIKETLRGAVSQLRTSGSREHMLAAVKLERGLDATDAEALLRELDSAPSHDPLALWTKLAICEPSVSARCDFQSIEANIRRNHSGNSAFWMAVAGHHLTEGQEELALDAMRMVVGAPSYDSYFAEQFLNIDRALAATTNWSAAERAVHTIEFVISSPTGLDSIMKKCVKLDAAWTQLCDQLAQRLSNDADDIMARGFGTALRVDLHEARNGSYGADELRLELQDEAFEFIRDEDQLDQALNALLNDETLLSMFLENLEAYGEIKAFERLIDDVERLRTTQGYDQCNFVGNPYVQL